MLIKVLLSTALSVVTAIVSRTDATTSTYYVDQEEQWPIPCVVPEGQLHKGDRKSPALLRSASQVDFITVEVEDLWRRLINAIISRDRCTKGRSRV